MAEAALMAASFLPEQVIFAKFFFRWTREVIKQCAGRVNISVIDPDRALSINQRRLPFDYSALK